MALTGLFLCTFLIGHLAGNMQLILKTGEEGRRAFNEYAYFMAHNPFIKVLSYVTYFSIIFHAVQGLYLAIQNKKARPQGYVYNKPSANSSLPSRYMAILGTLILVFIVTHMANFWWRAKIKEDIPLHTYTISAKDQMGNTQEQEMYYTHNLQLIPKSDEIIVKNKTELYMANFNVKIAEGYKDLHTVVMDFFQSRKKRSCPCIFNALCNFYGCTCIPLVAWFCLWIPVSRAESQALHPDHSRSWKALCFGCTWAICFNYHFNLFEITI